MPLTTSRSFCMRLMIPQFLLQLLNKAVSGWYSSNWTTARVTLLLCSLCQHFIGTYTIADGEKKIYIYFHAGSVQVNKANLIFLLVRLEKGFYTTLADFQTEREIFYVNNHLKCFIRVVYSGPRAYKKNIWRLKGKQEIQESNAEELEVLA